MIMPSRDPSDLNRLQHIGFWDIWDCNDKVSCLHHSPCLQQCKRPPKIALHVAWEVEAERDQAPLEVQTLPHRFRVCERKDWAVRPTPWEEGGHVATPCVHKNRIHFQLVGCNPDQQIVRSQLQQITSTCTDIGPMNINLRHKLPEVEFIM